jgi:CheY-like chemotaxis protein/GAF domain-containing protein
VADKPRVLFVGGPTENAADLPAGAESLFDVVKVQNPIRALAKLTHEDFDALFVSKEHFQEALRVGRLLENNRVLEAMPDAVAVVDAGSTILWNNDRLRCWANKGNIVGESFFAALGGPAIVGGDTSPFQSALKNSQTAVSLLRTKEGKHYQLHAVPMPDKDGAPHLVVTVRDVSVETEQQQKLAAIQAAGRELAGLRPEDVYYMTVAERKELLKKNILQYTQDLLKFDVVEIRLLDPKTGELHPLLEHGMDPAAASRVLYAKRDDNGVTGFVAYSGVSYLCDDTTTDPIYLEGVKGAKSSLTVPLKFEHQTIGTFNVESPIPHGFTEGDQLFVETFCRGVAAALNTLDLLSAQRANAAQESIELIHKAVALPIDEILSDACALAERFLSAEPEVAARLRRIVWDARNIKAVIQNVGRNMAPIDGVPVDSVSCKRPKLRGRRVLVVDPQDEVRTSAHSLLEPYGCVVDTAQKGSEAELLYQLSMQNEKYDVVVTGVDLPDMSGADLLIRLKAMVDPVPIILTQEFGHDPGHTLVRARRNGLNERAWIIKPFRAPQLLDTVEHILDWSKKDQTQA